VKLTDFDTLTFDCYGTLIDWESGIVAGLQPLLSQAAAPLSRDAALEAFAVQESAQQAETPEMRYADVLEAVHARLAREWRIAPDPEADRRFGQSIADWPAFPDTMGALKYLKQHYKLVVLSNVDHDGFSASAPKLGVAFDAVYTAQDIGSYKPDLRNFAYLIEHLAAAGTPTSKILHTAQSLFHDHGPANAVGLASAWIDRRHATPGLGATATPPSDVRWDFRFTSLEDMAQAHRRLA
jgi:2-haloacid dehalogenase